MLTPTERSGLKEILDDLSDSDLFDLANTVTKNLVTVTNLKDAIEAILSCLEKPSDLLRRQKVTKKVLFSYLLKKISFVSPESTKSDLVRICLTQWHSSEECRNNDYENSGNHSSVIDTQQNSNDWLTSFGTKFATWFFPIFNSPQGFDPGDFWMDCKVVGELKTAKEVKEIITVGSNEVVNFLRGLIVSDKFYFDANISGDSVPCEQDPHGHVRILVSGVVHQISNPIGLFDCIFGILKDPSFNDNWKIKWMHLKVHVNCINPRTIAPVNQLPSIGQ
ncbi:unnamed protein product [Larinioides sclopetarius]|uniref:Uncharacterized protein n=1 Tax=Larinioides sclopetarius TaxID=280406 RepID=A0AAV1ZY90_9ARAC